MADQQQTQPGDQDKKALQAAGVEQQHHDRALALKSQAQARGLDWQAVLDAIRHYGPVALDVIESLLGGGGSKTQAPTQTQAPKR